MTRNEARAAMPAVDALRRGVGRLQRRMRNECPDGGLALLALRILADLNRLDRETATAIALREGIKLQSLTRVVADLEARKLIRRDRDPNDRRSRRIHLTAKGRSELARESGHRNAWLAAAMAATLKPEERAVVLAAGPLLERLSVVAGEGTP